MGIRVGYPFVVILLAVVAGLAAVPATAGSAATGDDVILGIHFGDKQGRPIAGTTAHGVNFILFFDVATTTGLIQPVTLTVGLPSGLHWGAVAPVPADGCQGTAPAVCTASTATNGAGTVGVGWGWDVVADAAGAYTVSATVTPTQPDPNPANNTATFQFDVVVPTTSPQVAVTTPAVARAGSIVSATVHVSADGAPTKPTSISCTARVGTKKLRGTPHAASGVATCRYAPPRSDKGRTLRGAVTVSVDGKTITRRFSAKLR